MPSMDDDLELYEDPAFYAGINEGIFGMINGIWGLVDRGEGNYGGAGGYAPTQQNNTPLYIGFGILGFLLLMLILVMVFKK